MAPEPVSIEEVASSVSAVAEEADKLAERILAHAEIYNAEPITPEAVLTTAGIMREVLEREDHLVARAKEALSAARIAARDSANDAADRVTSSALAAYEMVRTMRTRTHEGLALASEIAEALGESLEDSRDAAFAHAQEELAARIEDGKAFATRIQMRASDLVGRL